MDINRKGKNVILDYEQVEDKLDELVKNTEIEEIEPLGNSATGIPIRQFTLGTGDKHIIISGAMHGSEIISTDVVLKQMEELAKDESFDINKVKIHFIPVLNPDGYIVTTSAIRTKIPRKMDYEESEKICDEYFWAFRKDDQEAIAASKIEDPEEKKTTIAKMRKTIKHYQEMFKDANYTCIPEKYSKLRQNIKQICEESELPKGCLISWSSNGNGVDLNSNSELNAERIARIKQIKSGKENVEEMYNGFRYNNISTLKPGPIGCPMKNENFEKEPEVEALDKLMKNLSEKNQLNAYFNYHGTGGMVYYKINPEVAKEKFGEKVIPEVKLEAIKNRILAEAYSRETSDIDITNKNAIEMLESFVGLKDDPRFRVKPYKIKNKVKGDPASVCGEYRAEYPANLLIELSKRGGNPIAPYSEEQNYLDTIKFNIQGLKSSLKALDKLNEIIPVYIKNHEKNDENKKQEER